MLIVSCTLNHVSLQRQLEAETRAVTTAMAAASIAAGVPMGAAPTIATSSMATSAASDVSTSASGQSKTPQRNKKQRGKKAKSADDEGQWPAGPVTLYTVRYDTWRSSSRNPWCHVIKRVGLSGDLHAETEALLTQFDVDYGEPCVQVLLCLSRALIQISLFYTSRSRWRLLYRDSAVCRSVIDV